MVQRPSPYTDLQSDLSITAAVNHPLHVATVNVRFDGARDTPVQIPHTGVVPPQYRWRSWVELPWAQRRSRLIDCLLSTGPLDIVGFQALLGNAYAHVGVGRDDGKTAGEYSPIFYDLTVFERVDWKTIWLSKTPDVAGSKDWDASQTRIATLLALRRKTNGALVNVINTHYDDQGKISRAESSFIIRELSLEFFQKVEQSLGVASLAHPTAIVLIGDLTDESGYGNITSLESTPSGKPAYTFLDSYTHLQARSGVSTFPRQSAPYGPADTYTSFGAPGAYGTGRIDFIFTGQAPTCDPRGGDSPPSTTGSWLATRYACLDNYVGRDESGWEGRWSDHRAVRVKLEIVGR